MKARLKKKEDELEKERRAHEEARRGFQEKQRELQRRASQLSKYVEGRMVHEKVKPADVRPSLKTFFFTLKI